MQTSQAPTEGLKRSPARILYAEDDDLVRGMTKQLLSRAGYAVTAVENGQLAWDALQTGQFELLITDNDMPALTGIQLVTKLRREKWELPVILASGSAGFYSGEEYGWLRFKACLQKPFFPTDLLGTVRKVLE